MVWTQVYDPLGNPWLSTLCAAIPIIVLLGSLAFFSFPRLLFGNCSYEFFRCGRRRLNGSRDLFLLD